MKNAPLLLAAALSLLTACAPTSTPPPETESIAPKTESPSPITHGPILGRQGPTTMGVMVRTQSAADVIFRVSHGDAIIDSPIVKSTAERDFTAHLFIDRLEPGKRYDYTLLVNGKETGIGGSFRTLPTVESVRNEHNPRGLFNFKFEFGCGNNQSPAPVEGELMPTFATMNRQIRDEVDFAILNGDFIYEIDRDFSVAQWQAQNEQSTIPESLQLEPTLSGVWQNYKTYIANSTQLQQWHAHVPTYFTMDDHEILNDVYGSGEIGRVDRLAVFRDIATHGWRDYVGWSNHTPGNTEFIVGRVSLEEGATTLHDPDADFSTLDLDRLTSLHIHWGEGGGMKHDEDVPVDDPNSAVYEVVNVIDSHTLEVHPPFKVDSESVYSMSHGQQSKMTISNCDIFLLDTRSYRQMHDTTAPDKEGLSILGKKQFNWLKDEMEHSDSDFFFLVSSVNFMVPHVGSNGIGEGLLANKDDAWTVFLDEREQLINFCEELGKPVFILTGDLHNSFAIQITNNVREFASGPHNSPNHPLRFEGNRPINGEFQYGPRPCKIRWSTAMLDDIEKEGRRQPVYCVVQVNNTFNNPTELGGTRHVAFPIPQVIFSYHSGLSGELLYSESILAN